MSAVAETARRLAEIPNLRVSTNTPLSLHTRFGIGGPADIYVEAPDIDSFVRALCVVRSSGLEYVVIGGGTNLIASDEGYRGVVLRFRSERVVRDGNRVVVDAGADLQALVDFTVDHGLRGLETLAGIPGSSGAAIYGNAGAYGHSVSEVISWVTYFDGEAVRTLENADCRFQYRDSIFKRNKHWIIFSAELRMQPADPAELQRIAGDIVKVRNEKFPPTMKCAGSVFKNLLLSELPPHVSEQVPPSVVREGKVPAAYFLQEAGAKGMARGDIRVASYHANLIYNAGQGTAADLCALIDDLKSRVRQKFGFDLEEEVQYIGFPERALSPG